MPLLGNVLIREGMINEQQLKLALQEQKRTRELLGEVLVRFGIVTEKAITRIVAFSSDIPYVDLEQALIDPNAVQRIDGAVAKRFLLMPFKLEDDLLYVAMDNPYDVRAIDTISRETGLTVEAYTSDKQDILKAIELHYSMAETIDEEIDTNIAAAMGSMGIDVDETNAPIGKLIDMYIAKGLRQSATDMHITPEQKTIRVSYRVDGVLQSDSILPIELHSPLITRVKILSGLNIAEQRLPQDGSMDFQFMDRTVDIRTATSPSIKGEFLSLRFLDKGNIALNIESLGFNEEEVATIKKLAMIPHGIILIAGPTGSGKTTTLYSMLKQINALEKNILTIEDPVEYEMPMIKQVQLSEQVGLTFEKAIRHFLRLDPDVLLIGEIRDYETALAAFQASMTGHLVFSTIHTNSASATVARLRNLGLELYYIPSTVRAIIAQRLLRILCKSCKEPYQPDRAELDFYGITEEDIPNHEIYMPKGCEKCNYTGYRGRTAIFEIFEMTPELSQAIFDNASTAALDKICAKKGMVTMRDSGMEKVRKGLTSLEEVIRVTM